MGMYYRMLYMKVNGCLDDYTNENGKVLPMSELCFVYRMTSKFTGHFYIGQTNDLQKRMHAHLDKIIKAIGGETAGAQPFHLHIAEVIKEKFEEESKDKRRKVKIEKFTRDALEAYIFAVVADKPTANMVEDFYIKQSTPDYYCLNSRQI